MKNDNLKHDIPTDTNNAPAVVFNVFTNEFGDRIVNQGSYYDKGGYKKCYSISIDGKYIKSVGGLKIAKSFINKKGVLNVNGLVVSNNITANDLRICAVHRNETLN